MTLPSTQHFGGDTFGNRGDTFMTLSARFSRAPLICAVYVLCLSSFGDITDQDIQTLIDTADADGDGRVSLADFRRMLPNNAAAQPPTAKK